MATRKVIKIRKNRSARICRICRAWIPVGTLVMSAASAHPASWVCASHLVHSSGIGCDGPAFRDEDGTRRCQPHGKPVYGTGSSVPSSG